jgi:hypothetical protein
MNDEYRFLLTDGEAQGQETRLICLDDEAALLMAERFALHGSVEVWDDARLVGTVGQAPARAAAVEPEAAPAPAPAPRRRHFWTGAWRRGLTRG